MRFVPVKFLKGDEILAVNITNINMQVLVKKGTPLKAKTIERIKRYGIQSVYINDGQLNEELDEIIKDTIKPEVRNFSVNRIKKSFDRFQERVVKQKQTLRYGDSGQDLFDGVKDISKDLINEIMLSKNTRVMMNDIKTSSDYHYKHSVNVAVLSLIIGTEMGLSSDELQNLAYGALLSDVGVKWVHEELVNKADKLSDEELKSLQGHVMSGYQHISDNTTFNAHVKSIIMHHHERMDGSGYPKGLTAKDIHPLAKIVMIADVYDALTSDRPHRPAYKQHEAIEYIMAHADREFDFKIANLFARKIVPYPVGTYVKLSNNQKGIVTKNNSSHPLRPIVRTFGKSDLTMTNDVKLDLLDNHNVVIEKIIYDIK